MRGTIGRLNGRFVVTWTEGGKRRRYRLDARTRAEAESEARDVILRETARVTGHTVQTLWEAYRGHMAGRRIADNMEWSGRALLPVLGALRPDQVTQADCRSYAATRAAAGIAPGTVHTELGHLRTCLMWAARAGLIPRAPAIERPAKPLPRERYLTRAEAARLTDAAVEPHVKLAILLALHTGARLQAILDLTWDRVDLERGVIRLALDTVGPRKGRATVPMNATLRAALSAAREATLSPYVVEWAGRPVASIKRGFATALAASGIAHCTMHDLRRTAGRFMVEAGVPIEEVAQFLGHSDPAVTRSTYARFSPDYLRAAAAALDGETVRKVQ